MDAAEEEHVSVTDASTSSQVVDKGKSIISEDNPLDVTHFKHHVTSYKVMAE